MSKFLFMTALLVFPALTILAQRGDLVARSSEKGLYMDHKVAAKETYYSLGRLYNLHPKSIAEFNKLEMNMGLKIDQKIRIPLLDTNFTQSGNSGTPVYFIPDDEVSLSVVSRKHNNVSIASLRAWNNLSGEKVKKATRLVIGFVRSKEMKSVTLSGPVGVDEKEVVKSEPSVSGEDLTKKEEKKIAEAEKKGEEKDQKSDSKKEATPVVIETRKPGIEGQGYFKNSFDQQIRSNPVSRDETVTAGIFKTTSGWEDAKYYLLMDNVQPGMIVRIINPATNKAVYAKVLGAMAGIRQNEGYDIRISNAAASALEITEPDKFIVKLNY